MVLVKPLLKHSLIMQQNVLFVHWNVNNWRCWPLGYWEGWTFACDGRPEKQPGCPFSKYICLSCGLLMTTSWWPGLQQASFCSALTQSLHLSTVMAELSDPCPLRILWRTVKGAWPAMNMMKSRALGNACCSEMITEVVFFQTIFYAGFRILVFWKC